MYKYLNNVIINCNQLSKIYEAWNSDIKDFNAKTKWKECLKLTYKATTNENLRLIQCKLMTRIYYSRDKIHKFDASLMHPRKPGLILRDGCLTFVSRNLYSQSHQKPAYSKM